MKKLLIVRKESVAQLCLTIYDPMDYSPPGCSIYGTLQATPSGVGCHFLLQGIFLIQGSNPGVLHCRWTLYHLSHQGSPSEVKVAQSCPTLCDPMDCIVHVWILQARILEWVVFPFSRGSSQPRGQSQVSHIAGGFFTSWAIREALLYGNRI